MQLAWLLRRSRWTPASRCPSGCRMIGNRFDLVLIHDGFCALVSSAGRHDPELSDLACGSTRPGLDSVRIDALVIGEVELRIYRTLGREVRTLLTWIGRTDDHETRIGFALQTQSHVVEHGFCSVVDAPRLSRI